MRDRTLADGDRGVSREGIAALGFGLTILMMAVVGGVLMEMGGTLEESGPTVSATAEPVYPGDGPDDQWVRIQRQSGNTVATENVTITVWLPEHNKRSTLTNLPTKGVEPSDYDHNHVFTLGDQGIEGAIDADDSDGRWSAGDEIAFRLPYKRVPLEPGQRVNVTVRHTPTETTLVELSLTVEER